MVHNTVKLFIFLYFLSTSLVATLNIADRPLDLKEVIQNRFQSLSQSKKNWAYGGSTSYYFFNTDSREFLKALIKSNPHQKEFFLLDIGAGDFQWGQGIANFLENEKDIKNGIMVHVLNVTGENFGETNIIKTPKCTQNELWCH